jgi:hypothetical protein
MAKKKLLEDIQQNPARIYRSPNDVLRDRRFNDGERLEILRAWRESDSEVASGIDAVIVEVENRLCSNHAAE